MNGQCDYTPLSCTDGEAAVGCPCSAGDVNGTCNDLGSCGEEAVWFCVSWRRWPRLTASVGRGPTPFSCPCCLLSFGCLHQQPQGLVSPPPLPMRLPHADLCAGVTCNTPPADSMCSIARTGYCVAGQCYWEDKTCTQPPSDCYLPTGTCSNSTGECAYQAVADDTTCSGTPSSPCHDPSTCRCQGGNHTFAAFAPACSSNGATAGDGCACLLSGANGTCAGGTCSELALGGLVAAGHAQLPAAERGRLACDLCALGMHARRVLACVGGHRWAASKRARPPSRPPQSWTTLARSPTAPPRRRATAAASAPATAWAGSATLWTAPATSLPATALRAPAPAATPLGSASTGQWRTERSASPRPRMHAWTPRAANARAATTPTLPLRRTAPLGWLATRGRAAPARKRRPTALYPGRAQPLASAVSGLAARWAGLVILGGIHSTAAPRRFQTPVSWRAGGLAGGLAGWQCSPRLCWPASAPLLD